jgi:hypothetical protein
MTHDAPGRRASQQLQARARCLERDLKAAEEHRVDFHAVATSAGVLAHLEEALHEFESGLHLMAAAASDWPRGSEERGDAEALRWHLAETARRLQAARDACRVSRGWSMRLLEGLELSINSAASTALPPRAAGTVPPEASPDTPATVGNVGRWS